MRALNIACGIFIGLVTWLSISLFFGGCGEDPEAFHKQDVPRCVQTPGDLYSYRCATKGYERCWTPTGDVKYQDCEYMGIWCVASCSEVD